MNFFGKIVYVPCGNYGGLSILQYKTQSQISKAQILERREKKQNGDEEERRAPTSRGRLESIMWNLMLSGPPRLLGRREKWMKKNMEGGLV